MNRFEWTQPQSLGAATEQLKYPGSLLKAGGVDLLDRLKEHLESPKRIVSLSAIQGLDGLHDEPTSGLKIGALVTVARLASEPAVRQRYPALADAANHVATPQVRNMATLGGNLAQRPRCWYFRSEDFVCRKKGGDACFALEGQNENHALFGNKRCAIIHPSTLATALVALGARVAIVGKHGVRELALEDFFVAPERDMRHENVLAADEIITEVRVPSPSANQRSSYIKQVAKESFDWPLADVAVVLELDGNTCRRASVVLGAAAPVPLRAKAAETALVGNSINADLAAAAGKAAMTAATPLSQNAFRIPIFEAVIARAVLAAAGRS